LRKQGLELRGFLMEVMMILVPLALGLGLVGLLAFLWSLRSGQYEDLDGAAWRAIADDEPENRPASRNPRGASS
jgi:cbb3-type cytochrome oxidase maturation protein